MARERNAEISKPGISIAGESKAIAALSARYEENAMALARLQSYGLAAAEPEMAIIMRHRASSKSLGNICGVKPLCRPARARNRSTWRLRQHERRVAEIGGGTARKAMRVA